MDIAFFTEGNFTGKIPRNHPNIRTDLAWQVALNAVHCPLYGYLPDPVELGVIIIPKQFDGNLIDLFEFTKTQCNKLAVMQEGPHWYFQGTTVTDQIKYLELLSKVDIIFCHNEHDRKYFSGLIPDSTVIVLPTLMIEDAIPHDKLCRPEGRTGCMIGGNWTSWYSGVDSYMIARDLSDELYAPSMGRKQAEEDLLEGIDYLPYVNWSEWMVELSKRKYAAHMMRTFAAGTFSLNCAYLGIPCIGYDQIDTQRLCFPELSVSEGDLESARKVAKHLNENKLFYDHVSAYAKMIAKDIYSEKQFIKTFYEGVEKCQI